jgi:orotate phosphoribosyltransferase
MKEMGVGQVAGKGVGSFFLVGGLIATGTAISGCMIRDARKAYGFREVIEGDVDRDSPLVLVDDILASGRTLVSAATALRAEGYRPIAAITIFRFGWLPGLARVAAHGLRVTSLATLHYRRPKRSLPSTPGVSWEDTRRFAAT